MDDLLRAAAREAGVDATAAQLIRDGSNVMYRLGDIVARIGSPGSVERAEREVQVARWLHTAGINVVANRDDLPQPIVVDQRPITWWALLPDHRPATTAELAVLLRDVHQLPTPTALKLPDHDPFDSVADRINDAKKITEDQHAWLTEHLAALGRRYRDWDTAESIGVIHGDAWQGNVAVPDHAAPILLDLEAVALGHRDWDLIQIAVDHTDFHRIDTADYHAFVDAYGGYDVTTTPCYRTLADIQELRWVSFALSKADTNPAAQREARHRLACIRGDIPRPWEWHAF